MDKITYVPIEDDEELIITKSELRTFYEKLRILYEKTEEEPERIIQLEKN